MYSDPSANAMVSCRQVPCHDPFVFHTYLVSVGDEQLVHVTGRESEALRVGADVVQGYVDRLGNGRRGPCLHRGRGVRRERERQRRGQGHNRPKDLDGIAFPPLVVPDEGSLRRREPLSRRRSGAGATRYPPYVLRVRASRSSATA